MSERALIVRHALTVLVVQWAVMAFGPCRRTRWTP